ncbi:MAG: phospholipase D-like domain-containing protein [Planctomycetota bacterium]
MRGWRRPRLLRSLRRVAHCLPTRGNGLELFHDGDQLFRSMLDAIRNAERRVYMEMYTFLADRTGWRFAYALAERAQAGVEVRIVYDAVGSFGLSASLLRLLHEAGVQTVVYHPVAPWRRHFTLFRRNHRKVLTVDGTIGYVGGVNIGDPWMGRRRGGGNWRDTHLRVDGPAAGDLEMLFVDTWYRETGEELSRSPLPREPQGDKAADARQVYIVGGLGGPGRRIRRLYLIALGQARRRVVIANSYFVPDRKFRKALTHARRRGLRVQLLLPLRSDVRVAQLASQSFFSRLLRDGIEIYLWRPTVLHAKFAVIDDDWWTVGSSNLDHWSFQRNLEANAVVLDQESGRALSARFERDLRFADAVELSQWRRRPFLQKVLERLASLLRGWLL